MTTHDVSVSGRPDMGDADPLAALMALYRTGCDIAQQHLLAIEFDICGQCAKFRVNFECEAVRLVVRVLEEIWGDATTEEGVTANVEEALAEWRKRAGDA